MKTTYIYPLLLGTLALLWLDSCQCNEPAPEVICPTCRASELCIDGVCECPAGHDYRYGECVMLSHEFSQGNPSGWGNKYIAMEGCMTYDSTVIWLESNFFEYLTDTTTPTVVGGAYLEMFKYYLSFTEAHSENKYMKSNSVQAWNDAEGRRRMSFNLGVVGGFGRFGTATFRPLPEYSHIDERYLATFWKGVFSADLDTIYFDIELRATPDGGAYTELLDSCQMTYHRLR